MCVCVCVCVCVCPSVRPSVRPFVRPSVRLLSRRKNFGSCICPAMGNLLQYPPRLKNLQRSPVNCCSNLHEPDNVLRPRKLDSLLSDGGRMVVPAPHHCPCAKPRLCDRFAILVRTHGVGCKLPFIALRITLSQRVPAEGSFCLSTTCFLSAGLCDVSSVVARKNRMLKSISRTKLKITTILWS